MDNLQNEFIKYLVDEIKRKSFANYHDIYEQVIEFAKAPRFEEAFKKWLEIRIRNKPQRRAAGPKHIFG